MKSASKKYLLKISYVMTLIGSMVGLFLPRISVAAAQDPQPITITPVVGFSSLNQAFTTLTSAAFLLGGILCFVYLMRGAYKYITAGENASDVSAARQTMQNAVIGLFILGAIFVIFRVVVNLIPGLGDLFT